jgi:hypothetical protein
MEHTWRRTIGKIFIATKIAPIFLSVAFLSSCGEKEGHRVGPSKIVSLMKLEQLYVCDNLREGIINIDNIKLTTSKAGTNDADVEIESLNDNSKYKCHFTLTDHYLFMLNDSTQLRDTMLSFIDTLNHYIKFKPDFPQPIITSYTAKRGIKEFVIQGKKTLVYKYYLSNSSITDEEFGFYVKEVGFVLIEASEGGVLYQLTNLGKGASVSNVDLSFLIKEIRRDSLFCKPFYRQPTGLYPRHAR